MEDENMVYKKGPFEGLLKRVEELEAVVRMLHKEVVTNKNIYINRDKQS